MLPREGEVGKWILKDSEWKSGMLGLHSWAAIQSTVSIGMKVREWRALEAIARALVCLGQEENVANTFRYADQDHTVYLFSNIY